MKTLLLALVAATCLAAEPANLGKVTLGDHELSVQAVGAPVPGGVWDVAFTVVPAAPKPKGVRLWIGLASAEGSVKSRGHTHGGAWDAHLEVPNPLPADSKLWISADGKDGSVVIQSLPLPK